MNVLLRKYIFASIVLVSLAATFAVAQSKSSGHLTGVVKDSQGGVIAGCDILAKNEATGAEFRAFSGEAGEWTIPSLPLASYTVSVTALSFRTATLGNIKVVADSKVALETTLNVGISQTIIVIASRTEEMLENAPAAVSVVDGRTIRDAPTQNFGDLLRTIPGVNVVQVSARDFNIVPRSASVTPAYGQLVMIDGRTITQDYFGYVAWDMNPISLNAIKQMEVLRGPASAVWGANALNGVVNIITKSPREMAGSTFTIGGGLFDRSNGIADSNTGTLFYVSASHAQIINDQWSFKLDGGYFTNDPFARPSGNIPGSNTPYPSYKNYGTQQPKVDLRADYDFPDGKQHLTMSGGAATSGGTFHTGLGPFRLEDGARIVYGKFDYSRNALSVKTFVNLWRADAFSLLAQGPQGPLNLSFDIRTWDIEISNTSMVHSKNLISYGGNYRKNWFDITMAPGGRKRDEGGGYIQDEIIFSDHFRWIVGGRIDKFQILDHAVFSPRTAFLIRPLPGQTFRVSYSRAYRAPSMFNNYLSTVIYNQLPLGLLNPALAGSYFTFPIKGLGSLNLKEQTLDSYEVGYSGSVAKGRVQMGATFYLANSLHDMILGQTASYTSQNPPPGWPLPPSVLDALIAGNVFGPGLGLPSVLSYYNLGTVRNKGVEANLDTQLHRYVKAFANYSWQAKPVPRDFAISKINLPPTNRFNTGLSFDYRRILGDLTVMYVDKSYWRDVLTYTGWSPSYTQVNTTVGVRFAGGKWMFMVKVNNLANRMIQNHVFGDLLKRQIVGEMRVRF